jgi:FKBP-type peptidyl-prolyl cis-trans isomerase FkpA
MLNRFFLFLLLVLVGCAKNEVKKTCTQTIESTVWTSLDQTQLTLDIQAIDAYLDANSKIAIEDPSGLRYIVTETGTGETPCLESVVRFKYTGVLMSNSQVFDENSTGVNYRLSGLIAGWRIAFLNFNIGTKATLYIPSGLAYGNKANNGIPANSNLIFFVELVDFE